MRTFVILWLGQMVSAIGSGMTYFALTLWVWHLALIVPKQQYLRANSMGSMRMMQLIRL